jgi:transcriptional regulator with GAF, ATPase, and Fis domain
MSEDETRTSRKDQRQPLPAAPGVVLLFRGGVAETRPVFLRGHGPLVLGRSETCDVSIEDGELSRRHATVEYLGDGRWRVRDNGSRNGTYVGAERANPVVEALSDARLRIGNSVLLLEQDVSRFTAGNVVVDDRVTGPSMQEELRRIAAAGARGDTLTVIGESGTGKEHAARVYHAAGRHARGPFVEVNCSTLVESIAEAQLFGATKGAYSGADSAQAGFFGAADGGTLFLDEIGTLKPELQAKLLRAIETKTIQPLGGKAPREVDVRIVCATNEDLARAVEEGRFRRDLLMRIAQELVVLPPLRERPEEIPHLVALVVRICKADVGVTADFIEACLDEPWLGNVREFLATVARAVRAAAARPSQYRTLTRDDLDAALLDPRPNSPPPSSAGARAPSAPALPAVRPAPTPSMPAAAPPISAEEAKRRALLETYERLGRDIKAAAAAHGVNESTAYRWLWKLGVKFRRTPK